MGKKRGANEDKSIQPWTEKPVVAETRLLERLEEWYKRRDEMKEKKAPVLELDVGMIHQTQIRIRVQVQIPPPPHQSPPLLTETSFKNIHMNLNQGRRLDEADVVKRCNDFEEVLQKHQRTVDEKYRERKKYADQLDQVQNTLSVVQDQIRLLLGPTTSADTTSKGIHSDPEEFELVKACCDFEDLLLSQRTVLGDKIKEMEKYSGQMLQVGRTIDEVQQQKELFSGEDDC